jgi:hypothetical protein
VEHGGAAAGECGLRSSSHLSAFAGVREGSVAPGCRRDGPPQDQLERDHEDVESVLWATPHEFESRILRHSPESQTAGQSQVLPPRDRPNSRGGSRFGSCRSVSVALSRGEHTALAVVWVTVIRPRRHTFRRSTTSTDHVVATTRVNPSSSPPSARSIVSSGSKPRPTKLQASSQRNQSSQPPGTMSAICTVTRPVLSQW